MKTQLYLIITLIFFGFLCFSGVDARSSFTVNNCIVVDSTDTSDVAYSIVEQMPVYGEGSTQDNIMTFLVDNLKYPESARKDGISGVVYVNFVIDEEGRLIDANVARGVDSRLDSEALRVVNAMQGWKPGYQRGKAVKVKYMLPIRFALKGGKKKKKKK